MSEKGGTDVNEAILDQIARMLLKERYAEAEQARVVRSAVNRRALLRADQPKRSASRTTCRGTEQAAY